MKKKIDYFIIREPLFGTVINCYIGWTYKEMLEDLADPNIEIPEGFDKPELRQDSGGVLLNCDSRDKTGMIRVLWLRHAPDNIERLGILAHECVHAGQVVCKYRGISTDWSEPEPLAHYTQYIFQQVLENCKKK